MIVERRVASQNVRAACAQAHARAAENVLDTFEKLAQSGKELRAGTQIRFGWTLFRLTDEANGLLVSEPDFAAWPEERWVSTIDKSLEVLAAQVRLLHRLDVDGEDAFFDQFVITAPGSVSQPKVFLRRDASISSEDSGWVLGGVEDPEALTRDDLERIAIANFVQLRPPFLQALSLPVGFIVQFSEDSIEQIFDAGGRARL